MARARVRVPESLEDFTRSDWETVIREAALGIEDTEIAKMYLLNAIAQADIGAEFNLTRSAISKRLLKIIGKVERTARKIGLSA